MRWVWITWLCAACGAALSAPRAARPEAETNVPPAAPAEDDDVERALAPDGSCEADPTPLELGDRELRVEVSREESGRSILRVALRREGEVRDVRCERTRYAGDLSSEREPRSYLGRLDGESVIVVLERADPNESCAHDEARCSGPTAIAWVFDPDLSLIGQVASEDASDVQLYGDVLVLGRRAYALRGGELVDAGPPPPPPTTRELARAQLSELLGVELHADTLHELHPTSCDPRVIEGIYVHLEGEETVMADLLVHVIDGGEERWLAWRPGQLLGIIDGARIEVDCVQCDGSGLPELIVRELDYRGPVDQWNALPQADVEHMEIVRLEDDRARTLTSWQTGAQPIAAAPYFAHRARISLGGAAPLTVVRERARGARAREGRALVAEGRYTCGSAGVVRSE